MSDHRYYRWTGKPHYAGPHVKVERGQVFEPTESEVKAFGDKMEPVDPSEVEAFTVSETTEADNDEGTRTSAPDPADLTVDELRDTIQEMTDPDALGEMYDSELGGKGRETALEAIDSRINAVSGE